MKTLMILTSVATLLTAGVAQAGDLGWTSSGSMNVTVTIAPLGGAIAASEAGAQGLWSIGAGNRGLMIQAPSEIETGTATEVSLFAAQTGALTIRPLSPNVTVYRGETASDRGFSRQSFDLKLKDKNDHSDRGKALYVVSTI